MDNGRFTRKGAWLDVGAAVLLAAACALFFRQAVALKGVFFYYDNALQNFPYRLFFTEGLLEGRLRLWTNSLFCGFPLFAEGQANPLYPLFPLIFAVFRPWVAYNYYVVIHYFLAGLFSYLLARTLGTPRVGALVAGLVYMFSGPLVAHAHHTNIVVAIAWLPALLMLIELTFRRSSLVPVCGLAVAVGMFILGAQPQYVLYGGLACAAFLAWRLRIAVLSAEREGQGRRRAFALGLALCLAAMLGAGLAAAQMVPLVELIGLSSRAGVGAPMSASSSISPAHFITLLLPHYFGAPALGSYWETAGVGIYAENAVYVGFLPLLLAAVGVAACRQRKSLFFALLAGFSLILCLGEKGSLYPLLSRLPFFRGTRWPARFGFVTALCVAQLAAMGFSTLLARSLPRRQRKAALLAVALMALLAVGTLAVAGAYSGGFRAWSVAELEDRLPLTQGAAQILWNYLHRTLPADVIRLALACAAGSTLVMVALSGRLPRGIIAVLGCGLVFAELAFIGRKTAPVTAPEVFSRTPELVRFLRRHGPGRVFRYRTQRIEGGTFSTRYAPLNQGVGFHAQEYDHYVDFLPLNSNMLWDVPAVNGFSPLQTRALKTLLGRPEAMQTIIPYGLTPPLDLLGARYIISRDDELPAKYRPLGTVGEMHVYENPSAMPRVFVVHRARRCDDRQAVRELTEPSFDYGEMVLLPPHVPDIIDDEPGVADPAEYARIVRDEGDSITVAAKLSRDGYLVLCDQFYPGWEVEVDGRLSPLLRVDYLLKGVRLSAGLHEVRFVFRPASLRLGAAVSLGTAVIVVLTCIAVPFLHRRFDLRGGKRSTPATERPYRRGVARFSLALWVVCLVLSPAADFSAWKRAPYLLNPHSWVFVSNAMRGDSLKLWDRQTDAFGFWWSAYRHGPPHLPLKASLADQCEMSIEELLEDGKALRAAEFLRQWAALFPEDVKTPRYRSWDRRIQEATQAQNARPGKRLTR